MKSIFFITFYACFFTALLSTSLSAQSYVFKVMASSGTQTSTGKVYPSTKGKSLVVGNTLQGTDQIVMPDKSYLSLMHSSGGTVQIAKAGTYSVSDLANKLKASTQTASQRYASYVIGELTKNDEKNLNKYPHKYQNVTGSVERATFESELVSMLPSAKGGSYVFNQPYLLNWHHLAQTKNYILIVLDQFDETLHEVTIPDTSYTLNVKDEKFAEADMLKIVILSKERTDVTPYKKDNNYNFSYSLNFLEGSKKAEFEQAFEKFKKEQATSSAPEDLKKLDEATFFETQGFLLDAMRAYKELLQLDPKNEAYEIVYNQFLVRHQIGKHKEVVNSENK